ncbi:hypothetical protein [Candidatus Xianfuyuplasma coldseepsis]|uniref:Ferric oxidoreductase domain-containing protein n=1 Tax=Candidatus Xianfuyuplasma coldseepsis TaxID=2782163 RepID=A0A7L7KQ28_9MOLU|nr:hypothetical protein [Xianfuyuplasma coldseepsis]QMS84296.1 hypothetical protein G4Z02_00585 [Xianfuyuplasma coldseepsis]
MIGVILVLLMLLIVDVMSVSLNILAVAGMLTALLYKWPHLFQARILWYFLSLVLAVLAVIFHTEEWMDYVTRGYLPYAILFVVMMVGVLPNKWTVSRHIKKRRGTLSIMGFILISPHAVLHVFEVFDGINLFGIVAYVLMVPLTIISFQIIKREIKPKDWLLVQKAAYIIYLALFAHLLWVGEWFDKVIYGMLLILYVNNKLLKEFSK